MGSFVILIIAFFLVIVSNRQDCLRLRLEMETISDLNSFMFIFRQVILQSKKIKVE